MESFTTIETPQPEETIDRNFSGMDRVRKDFEAGEIGTETFSSAYERGL